MLVVEVRTRGGNIFWVDIERQKADALMLLWSTMPESTEVVALKDANGIRYVRYRDIESIEIPLED